MRFLSPLTHSSIGAIVGIALFIAPSLFGFSNIGGATVAFPIIIGVIVILSELTVRGSFSRIGFVPMSAHIVMDIIVGAFLAISPWLFGFANQEANAWLPHLIVGIMLIGAALITQREDDKVMAYAITLSAFGSDV